MLQVKRRGRLVSARREVAEQNRIRNAHERRLSRQLATLFDKIADQVAEDYQSGGPSAVRTDGILPMLSGVLVPHYRSIIVSMADRFQTVKVKREDFEQLVQYYLRNKAGTNIVNVTQTTINQVRRVISDVDKEGLGPRAVAKAIKERIGGPFGRRRAFTIARTETHSAASFANHEVAKSLNVPMRKQWVSTNDERTRSWHSAINGQTVDMEDDFIVPYKGVDYRMKHAGDPAGGPANVINCRCVIIYLEPEDVVIDDEPQEPVSVVQEPPEPVIPTDDEVVIPFKNKYDPVRRVELNGSTMAIMNAKEALEKLTQRVARNAESDDYKSDLGDPVVRYSGRNRYQIGKVILPDDTSDKMATALYRVMDELDAIADRCGVPRLRGICKAGGTSTADMGDAIMGWNVAWWKKFSDAIGETVDIEGIEAARNRVAKFHAEKKRRMDEIGAKRDERDKLALEIRLKDPSDPEIPDLKKRLAAASDELDKLTNDWRDWFPKANGSIEVDEDYLKKIGADKPVSTWKMGDDPKNRPWSVKEYWSDPLDQIRSTMYHEIGHHIHQMWKPRLKGYSGTGKLENVNLKGSWRHKQNGPSQYSAHNKYEWFAENFSLFWMGRRDLVTPSFIDMMEEVLGVEIPR